MGKVPAIVDPETNIKLAESHAIMRYLCRKYPTQAGSWYGNNDYLKQARIDEYLDFHHSNTRKCHYYLFN
jgi:glutathione S-transferase